MRSSSEKIFLTLSTLLNILPTQRTLLTTNIVNIEGINYPPPKLINTLNYHIKVKLIMFIWLSCHFHPTVNYIIVFHTSMRFAKWIILTILPEQEKLHFYTFVSKEMCK